MKRLAAIMTVLVLAASFAAAAADKQLHKELPGKKKIEISADIADVTVTGYDGDKIIVDAEYDRRMEDELEFNFDARISSILIEQKMKQKKGMRIGNSSGKVVLNIRVPANSLISVRNASGNSTAANISGRLTMSIASGNIEVRGMKGDYSFKSASGNIRISNIRGDGDVEVASGNIEAADVTGKMNLSTASGNIRGDKLEGVISVRAASGNIRLKNCGDIVHGSTASGDIDLRDCKRSGELTTASGKIMIDGSELKQSKRIGK